MASSRWWFVRHGQSVANRDGYIAGHTDSPLTRLGERQAKALTSDASLWTIQRLLSSDLTRASTTAKLAMAEHPLGTRLEQFPALRERCLGDWEGIPLSQLRADGRMNTMLSWDGRPPNGESQLDMSRRVIQWLASNTDESIPTAIFAHGGVIRCLLGLLSGADLSTVGTQKIKNASPIEYTLSPGTWLRMEQRLASGA